jgi:hypothetical protein
VAIVCIVLAFGLFAGAIGARDEGAGVRVFFLIAALLNAAAAAHMIATDYGYRWRLAPSVEDRADPGYHYRR